MSGFGDLCYRRNSDISNGYNELPLCVEITSSERFT